MATQISGGGSLGTPASLAVARQPIAPDTRNGSSRYDQAEVIATIKATVCKGASDAQLAMFIRVCKETGLSPWLKEIYFVAEKSIIMASRDGYLRVANESPMFDGMETRVERDEKNVPIKATCSVWRKDRSHAITCEAFYSEYKKAGPVWSQYPSAMISKVAEVLALKRSFAINGVVTEEEMGAAPPPAPQPIRQPQPAAQIAAQLPADFEDDGRYTYEEEVELTTEDRSHLEQELAESLLLAERRKVALEAFATMKRRYAAVNMTPTWYEILGRHGVRHASDFRLTPEGMADATACFAEMRSDVALHEARGK